MTEQRRMSRLDDLPAEKRALVEERLARTPEERLEEERVRDWFERHRPGPGELAELEDGDPCFLPEQVEAVRGMVGALKAERARLGLSLADLAERTGLTRPAISRLENGHRLNPTLDTLYRYARALGRTIALISEPHPQGPTPSPQPGIAPMART